MSVELLVALVALTYGSRVAALAVLPPLPTRLSAIFDRMPPALFAGLAAQSLLDASGAPAAFPVLAAAAGALVVAPLRSLPLCLVGGAVAYALAAYGLPAITG
jgi:branched-subunit amino acid transport protein